MGGAFSWSDSPRHALNGAFVLDLIKTAPFDDPAGFAYHYYSQYPALTILFYPPLFSFLLAPFYALFGISQETALFTVFISYCFFACGIFYLARMWFQPFIAFGVAVILACSPEVMFWGRQVMLEIPAFAFLVWSIYFLIRHMRSERIFFLYLSMALLVLAAYTKISVIFVIMAYVIALLQSRGFSLFRDKHSYLILAISTIGMMPLIYLTLNFGQANIQSAAGISDSLVSRHSLQGWLWYAREIPAQIGWPAFMAVLCGLCLFLLWERSKIQLMRRNLFFVSFFIIGYLFFSAIDLKEARHSIYLLLPLVLFIGLTSNMLEQRKAGTGMVFVGTVAFATIVVTILFRPVHYVDGYKNVVNFVSERAPENSNILFSGYRDGAFIFNMRAHSNRPDISIIRADKLLLRVSVRRSLGVEEKQYDIPEISNQINKLAIHYVVAQPDFWTDLDQMKKLQSLLNNNQFKEIKRFKMTANYPGQEKELILYKNLGDVATGPVNITNELPIINRTVSTDKKQD